MPPLTKVKKAASQKELKQAFSIRVRVFVHEQGVPRAIELDDEDMAATHFVAYIRGRVVGTARLVVKQGKAKIGRMAVLKSFRNKGVGKELLKHSIASAEGKKVKTIFLHAQVPVIGFYRKMGFRCVGPIFKEAGISHRKMILVRGA